MCSGSAPLTPYLSFPPLPNLNRPAPPPVLRLAPSVAPAPAPAPPVEDRSASLRGETTIPDQ